MKNRAGTLVQNLTGEMAYKSYKPVALSSYVPQNLSQDIYFLLTEANKKLAYLNGVSSQIPDIDLFVSMYVRKEALLSSRIEGTQCTLDDIFDPSVDRNKNLEVSDVVNYVRAMEYGLDRMQTMPICSRLLKEIHAVLLANVRGADKNPGEFRSSQNWIGPEGSTLRNASYVPPNVVDMQEAMSNLEKYINGDNDLDYLIQAALVHYQFETIHPFLDGNGRIGRLLIVLFLISKKLLFTPVLYLSYFLKQNRIEYYDRMTQVRRTGDYEQWVEFFLRAVKETAEDSISAIEKLQTLHKQYMAVISEHATSRTEERLRTVFAYVERNPILDVKNTAVSLGMAYNTVAVCFKKLCAWGILKQRGNNARMRIFAYEDHLAILRADTE